MEASDASELSAPLIGEPKLRRELTLVDSLSVVVGLMVGSGIFTTPGVVLAQAGSVGEGLIVWVVAGGITLCLAIIYGELGAAIPVASGDAEYHKRAFGPSWGFAFIWTSFLVLYSGSINIFATGFSQYLLTATTVADVAPEDLASDGRIVFIAIASVVGLTICNCAGARFGSSLQNLLNLFKTVLVVGLVVVALVFVKRDPSVLQANFSKPFVGSSLLGFGPSMVAALWAFCGVSNIVFLSEEMKNPRRDLPRACIGGIVIVTGTYLAVNFSYLAVLPSSEIVKSFIVAMDSTKAALGEWAGRFTAMLVAISLLGTLNGVILCGARYLFSAARDDHFQGGWLRKLSQNTGAPLGALVAQGVWCVVLLLVSTDIVKLLSYFSIASYFFSGLIAIAHWKLRYQCPELPRPFRVPLHPCANIFVLGSAAFMIVSSVLNDPVPTLGSLFFILSSFPVYYIFVKKKNLKTLPGHEHTVVVN